jgi:integration host factor subunit beta
MTKKDLIRDAQSRLNDCPAKDVAYAVNLIFTAMTEAFKRNERIDLRGFGSFAIRCRRARLARNPKNGSSVQMEAKRVPLFKVGKELKERINVPR